MHKGFQQFYSSNKIFHFYSSLKTIFLRILEVFNYFQIKKRKALQLMKRKTSCWPIVERKKFGDTTKSW